MTKQTYIEYLLNTPVNYTCSNLAEHLDGVSHAAVSDFLQRGRVTASRLWELVEPLLNDSEAAYLIVDDIATWPGSRSKFALVNSVYPCIKSVNVFSMSS